MTPAQPDQPTLTISGITCSGWTSLSVRRRIDHISTLFNIALSQQAGSPQFPSQIQPFSPCVLKLGNDVVLTGYIDEFSTELSGTSHTVSISGRSKTADLIDCAPDITSGQYKGYTLEQIARAVCGLYGIGVIVQTPADQVFIDATLNRGETGLAFLERQARSSSVLLTDDPTGSLVLTTAGTTRAAGRLMQGGNVQRGSVKLDVKKRFSTYIVKGQRAIGSANTYSGLSGFGKADAAPAPAVVAPVVTNLRAVANDTGVPRYRPTISMAEMQLDQAGMQARANWERNYAFGRATEAVFTVAGWRQPDGTLWQINQLVSVTAPSLQIDQDLLIAGVTFSLDNNGGCLTTLQVGPVEGYTPSPGQVKLHTRRGKKGTTLPAMDGFGVS